MRDDLIYRLEYMQATISSFTIRIAQQTQINLAKDGGNYCEVIKKK